MPAYDAACRKVHRKAWPGSTLSQSALLYSYEGMLTLVLFYALPAAGQCMLDLHKGLRVGHSVTSPSINDSAMAPPAHAWDAAAMQSLGC